MPISDQVPDTLGKLRLRWWIFLTGLSFCLLLSGIVLSRSVSETSAVVQAWLFIAMGVCCLVVGVTSYVSCGKQTSAKANVGPKALWPLGVLGLASCATGLFWTWWLAGQWVAYAALPVMRHDEMSGQVLGSLVRVEGLAHSQPPLFGADGSVLALQWVEFSHSSGKSDYTDYERILPDVFLLKGQTDNAAERSLSIQTTHIDKDFSLLQETYSQLDGTSAEVKQRIKKLISPAFEDYKYVRGSTSHLGVMSLPQDVAVTVCGTIETVPGSNEPQVKARSISMLTGERFMAKARKITGENRSIGFVWWSIGIVILIVIGLLSRDNRRERLQDQGPPSGVGPVEPTAG
jgi:hypothetical protein